MKLLSTLSCGTILGSLIIMQATTAYAADDAINPKDLVNLSLEQLSNIQITSVSKKSEKASEAAAAIFVITQDDIRRSGMTSIPELLRMVPGLSVAQSGSHEWSITSRGNSGQFANKLLVLMDGRTIYTPIFSGVFWDVQDTMMEDIDRIEVIRGPGATLWGANAVNGVINIITKNAKDTTGGMLSETAGNVDKSLTNVRYGSKLGDDSYGRMYAKFAQRRALETVSGRSAKDDWDKGQSGFRVDSSDNDVSYTFQADGYHAGEQSTRTLPTLAASNVVRDREIATGANILGRMNFKQSDTSQWTLQMYLDNAERRSLNLYQTAVNTLDFDLQNTWTASERHEIVWGTGYRLVGQNSEGTLYSYFMPSSRTDNLYNAFVQDKIAILPKQVFLTLGSKFEHNAYTGFETQPSARVSWIINEKQTWWASASHAVRTPNIFSENGSLVLSSNPGVYYVAAEPNKSTASEELNAYETGYRIQPTKKLSFDFSTYLNKYSKLITSSLGSFQMINIPGVGATPVVPVTPINGNSGTSTGMEIAANWEVTSYWQLAASYTRLNFSLDKPELAGFSIKGTSPKDQANLRSTLSLPHDVEITNALYYVDKLTGPNIPSYIRFDSRLAWKAMDNMEISLVGQNLFDNAHQEYSGFVYEANSKVPRTFYGNVTWKF